MVRVVSVGPDVASIRNGFYDAFYLTNWNINFHIFLSLSLFLHIFIFEYKDACFWLCWVAI